MEPSHRQAIISTCALHTVSSKTSPVKQSRCRTYMNGLFQLGVVLRGQQGPVITRVALQSFLCAAGCHPNPCTVLVGHTFTHVPFHLENGFCNYWTSQRHRAPRQTRAVFVTCQVLLHMRLLLQELGPSDRPSVEDSHILTHHILIGLEVVRSLEAVGVNPASGKSTKCKIRYG